MPLPKELLKKVRNIEIRTRHIVNDVFAGSYHSAFQGQGMEFQEVREYFPGDDIRSIDWNVTARMNAPFIKKFREERELTMMLVVDISASHDFGSTELMKRDVAAEIAAVLAFAAIKNNDKVGLILHTDKVEKVIAPGKGSRHVLRVISDVLSATPEDLGTDFAPAIDHVNLITHRKSIVFFISDFITDKEFRRPISVLGRKHDTAAIIIGDQRERDWPKTGLIDFTDPETGKRSFVDFGSAKIRAKLSERFDQRRENILAQLRRAGVDTVEIRADQPYERALMKFFKMRAGRPR